MLWGLDLNPHYLNEARKRYAETCNFSSMLTLKDNFALVDPIGFQRKLASVGFRMVHEVRRPVLAGKGLWMGVFERY